ncbi:MAG: Rho termination factor N-terminal domain-containing protein, partial [Candidatus Izemoplasma sp.]
TKPVVQATKPVVQATKPVVQATKPVVQATKPVAVAPKVEKKVSAPVAKPVVKKESVDFGKKTVAELRTLAKDKGLTGYSKLKKADLIEALK